MQDGVCAYRPTVCSKPLLYGTIASINIDFFIHMKFRALNIRQSLWRKLATLLLLSTILLGAQIASQVHGFDHAIHPHHELCDSFLAFQNHVALLAFVVAIAVALVTAGYNSIKRYATISLISSNHNIRAPPAISALH